MPNVGYEHLRQRFNLSALPPWRAAVIRTVTRVEETTGELLVPVKVAPRESDSSLSHVLFALRYEGVDLQILAEAMLHVPEADVRAEVAARPTGRYARLAGFLWEAFNGREIEDLPAVGGNFASVFDTKHYVTGARRRNTRWRIDFNGLGTLRYCATVRRTPKLQTLLEARILERTNEFMDSLGPDMQDRALSWAYMHETEASYEIERERAGEDRARLFAALLRQAHEPRRLDEAYLVDLQNAVLSNPYERATGFRGEQNWLRSAARGALGVSYVPPPPELARELMAELMALANSRIADPEDRWMNDLEDAATGFAEGLSASAASLVCASVISFGFVYLHPFMDGNGRLSRFLFHKALFQCGELRDARLLPISVAMKRNEQAYLDALQSYSRPMRERWTVTFIDEGRYDLRFEGADSLYRFWDATTAAEFCLEMAEQTLEIDLQDETRYLTRFDVVRRGVEDLFDVRQNTLVTLIHACLRNDLTISRNLRRKFDGQVPPALFDAIEKMARESDPARMDGDG
jgi:fido (protein-threonine AMPylation protein)